MSGKRKKGCLAKLLANAMGLLVALALGALFYAVMVYQLAGEDVAPAPRQAQTARQLTLAQGTLVDTRTETIDMDGATCRVVTRTYRLADGKSALAISATTAAYIERLSREGWQPQLITGFVLAGLDAVYEARGERRLLAARDGEAVYVLEGELDEQTLYALGAGAWLSE